jgi:hypothetical protein
MSITAQTIGLTPIRSWIQDALKKLCLKTVMRVMITLTKMRNDIEDDDDIEHGADSSGHLEGIRNLFKNKK